MTNENRNIDSTLNGASPFKSTPYANEKAGGRKNTSQSQERQVYDLQRAVLTRSRLPTNKSLQSSELEAPGTTGGRGKARDGNREQVERPY